MAAVPEFDGKTAIVTGGARGLGRAITRMLVDRGATVAIIDLDEKTAAETTRDLKRHNGKIHHVTGDIRFRDGARAAVAETARQLGRLDILVNNAGVYPRKPLLEIDDEAWDHRLRRQSARHVSCNSCGSTADASPQGWPNRLDRLHRCSYSLSQERPLCGLPRPA